MNEEPNEAPALQATPVVSPVVNPSVQQDTEEAAQDVERKLNLQKYNKAFVAVAGLIATVLVQIFGKNPDVQVVVSLLTAAGVHLVPNKG